MAVPREVLTVPFVYGTMAFWLGKKAEETKTHKWHVYVRGINNEDLSPLIQSVSFHLHPSFKDPLRIVDEAPFLVVEHGWGEFEIPMRITLHEPPGTILHLSHMLSLFPSDQSQPKTSKPVVSEHYDQLVLHDPSPSLLRRAQMCTNYCPPIGVESFFTQFSEEQDLMRIQQATRRVQAEIQLLQDRYSLADAECALLYDEAYKMGALGANAADPSGGNAGAAASQPPIPQAVLPVAAMPPANNNVYIPPAQPITQDQSQQLAQPMQFQADAVPHFTTHLPVGMGGNPLPDVTGTVGVVPQFTPNFGTNFVPGTTASAASATFAQNPQGVVGYSNAYAPMPSALPGTYNVTDASGNFVGAPAFPQQQGMPMMPNFQPAPPQ